MPEIERKAIGIVRESALAGKPESDALIIKKTADFLRQKHGFKVTLMAPNKETAEYLHQKALESDDADIKSFANIQVLEGNEKTDLVFSMARGEDINAKLQKLVDNGAIAINHPTKIRESMNRELSHQRMVGAGVQTPRTEIRDITEISPEGFDRKVIVKRTDRHECTSDIEAGQPLNEILENYKTRGFHDESRKPKTYQENGINRLYVQDFVDGQHVKYYMVGDRIWGTEAIDDPAIKSKTEENIRKTRDATGLEVFGGDVMIDKEGKAHMVDANDWPSFSSVREEAGEAIADLLASKLKE